ncbi:anaerobic ribonucleoside-triphosphate reductase activating protein [Corynebacterium pseudotuberculosis]|uniref:anaerobic ribonucleoside-triphosphate reductase activating protein n=1 Tax=Corynebacterium pseudotuberculosis TaxID=1719 RepID=UPI0005190C16|nr:anaerobic ribonucleoside-triphosphate reductase activating protein [Corynebacterium pseudotuberculosis]AMN71261.1 anaerobic ribonucleoside-triphosphate reductase activating protein [Corynebacterium pseudotuberculosis]AMN75162.1 anaerobic ribonucleoside-triphosphate reductase activating protein [Corynebacterium pseudotuberculosis]ANZ91320.1 anaerobic ribonucleoside-triphosphate reductase activating protein [Corynebacterium pseudotuberculosis]APB10302.1 anaerobic ribonucleoside-triphosphate re
MSAPTLQKRLLNQTAAELPIAGIIPFSATDWPGKLVAAAFTQGCPLRCVYCHNSQLQAFTPGAHSLAEFLSLLSSRHGLIDAAVISGGEPTAVRGLGDAIAAIHNIGFPVGIHTCGYAPSRIAELLRDPDTTPDWVGLDIKALPRHMREVTGCSPRVATAVWESLRILQESEVAVTLRTTLWEGSVIEQNIDELRSMVKNHSMDSSAELVIQHARAADGSPWTPDCCF